MNRLTLPRGTFIGGTAAAVALPIAARADVPAHRNIVLVHGAWSDGSGWSRVIPMLQTAGHTVVAVQNQMLGLAADAANTRAVIDALAGPTVAVGHSYGGAVITAAARDAHNVTGLVYIAAFAPEEGESLSAINARFTPPSGGRFIAPGPGGLLYIDRAHMPEAFASDVDASQAAVMAAVQRPVAPQIFSDTMTAPAWKQHKSWYQVSTDDRMIDPEAERFMAARIGAETISLRASHASLVARPRDVAELILRACRA